MLAAEDFARRYGGGLAEFEEALLNTANAKPEPERKVPKMQRRRMTKEQAEKVSQDLDGYDGRIKAGRLTEG